MGWVLAILIGLVIVLVLFGVLGLGRRPAPARAELVAILLARYFALRRGDDGLPPGPALNKTVRASNHLLGVPQDSGFWELLDSLCRDQAPKDINDERAEMIFVTSALYAQLGYVDDWFRTFESSEAIRELYKRLQAEPS
jgi:hypothetical protein